MIENFDRLSDDEKAMIHALPYRVGLWMSALEPQGGDVADEAEVTAMIGMIEFIAKANTQEFAGYICRQTIARRADWPAWSQNLDHVPDECRRVVRLLTRLIPPEDLDGLRASLLQITVAVARAFGEAHDGINLIRSNMGAVPPAVTEILSKSKPGADLIERVSGLEAGALLELADHLGLAADARMD